MDYEFLDHLTDAILVLDSDQTVIYSNQVASNLPRDVFSDILTIVHEQAENKPELSVRNWKLYTYPYEGNVIVICQAELQLDQRIQGLKADFHQRVQSGDDPVEVAAQLLYRELGWKWVSVAHYLDDERFEVDALLEDGVLYGPFILEIANSPCELVRNAQNFIFLDNIDKRYEKAAQKGARVYAGMVYRSSEGQEIGHVYMLNDHDDIDVSATRYLLGAICAELGIFLELGRAKQELEVSRDLSLTDPLTGIANRRSFDEDLPGYLETSKQKDQDFAIIFLDLDGFKQLNDEQGHKVGDQALVRVAQKGRALCSKYCKIYRYGGDEFVILSKDPTRWTARELCDKRHILQDYLAEHGFDCLGISVGAATYLEAQFCQERMLHLADERMYADKRQRKQAHRAGCQEISSGL